MNDNARLENVAKRLGTAAAARLDVEATARRSSSGCASAGASHRVGPADVAADCRGAGHRGGRCLAVPRIS